MEKPGPLRPCLIPKVSQKVSPKVSPRRRSEKVSPSRRHNFKSEKDLRCRGNRTPLELFLAGTRDWGAGLQRLLYDGKFRQD